MCLYVYISLSHRCKSGFIGFQPFSSLNNIQNKEDIHVRSSSPVVRFLNIICTHVVQYPVQKRVCILYRIYTKLVYLIPPHLYLRAYIYTIRMLMEIVLYTRIESFFHPLIGRAYKCQSPLSILKSTVYHVTVLCHVIRI